MKPVSAQEIIGALKSINITMDIAEDTALFDAGVMDSFTVYDKLLPLIMDTYGIDVDPLELVPENFETPRAIAEYVNKARKEDHE